MLGTVESKIKHGNIGQNKTFKRKTHPVRRMLVQAKYFEWNEDRFPKISILYGVPPPPFNLMIIYVQIQSFNVNIYMLCFHKHLLIFSIIK